MTTAAKLVQPVSQAPAIKKVGPAIYQLRIERFRGVQSLTWRPETGLNVILGGGDAGKSTILDAIALLFSPSAATTVSDADYYCRRLSEGFEIEAVMRLPDEGAVHQQYTPLWPWEWNGSEVIVPSAEGDPTSLGDPVYCVRVSANEELELSYEVVQPNGTTLAFSVALRRAIGLVRLAADERNERDLRLVQGSALDRLLSDRTLRGRMTAELAKNDVRSHLEDDGQKALDRLDAAFKTARLPHDLSLAVTGGHGSSVASMIGLTADQNGIPLPLSNWGAGTRRLAGLVIAEQQQALTPVVVVDEIER